MHQSTQDPPRGPAPVSHTDRAAAERTAGLRVVAGDGRSAVRDVILQVNDAEADRSDQQTLRCRGVAARMSRQATAGTRSAASATAASTTPHRFRYCAYCPS